MNIGHWSRLEREGACLYAGGNDAAAAERFRHAARVARTSGRDGARLASSLFHLAMLHQSHGHYSRAEQLCVGSLRAEESALGPNHPFVADILRRRATILRKLDRPHEADLAEARAQAIMTCRGRASRGGAS